MGEYVRTIIESLQGAGLTNDEEAREIERFLTY